MHRLIHTCERKHKMTKALTTTAKVTGKIVGLLGAIAMVALGAFLIVFGSNITNVADIAITEISFLIWATIMAAGLVIGTAGLLAIFIWGQNEFSRRQARH